MVPVSGTVLHFATHYLRSEANLIPDECFCFKMHYGHRNLGLVKPKSRLPVEGFIVLSLNKKKKEKKRKPKYPLSSCHFFDCFIRYLHIGFYFSYKTNCAMNISGYLMSNLLGPIDQTSCNNLIEQRGSSYWIQFKLLINLINISWLTDSANPYIIDLLYNFMMYVGFLSTLAYLVVLYKHPRNMWGKLCHRHSSEYQRNYHKSPKLTRTERELGSEQFYSEIEEYKSVTAGLGSLKPILNLIMHSGALLKGETSNRHD